MKVNLTIGERARCAARDYAPSERGELDGWPGVEAQRVLWGDAIKGSAREILARFEEKPDGERKSVAFLREALKGGPRLAAEVFAEAALAGIPKRTLQRALNDMGGTAERHGVGSDHFTVWEMPRLDA